MGCESSRQVKMAKLKMMSSNALNERLVENIMMNSYFNESELCILYKRFQELQPNSEGKICNRQLMELRELKFCPFKKFLPNALRLESDDKARENFNFERNIFKRNTVMVKDDNLDEDELDRKLKNYRKFDEVKNEDKLDNINDNYVNSIDKRPKTPTDKLLLKENNIINSNEGYKIIKSNTQNELDNIKNNIDKDANLKVNIFNQTATSENYYIDFPKFCEILRVFNDKYPIDLKIRFYFKLFDVNGDGRISKDDLLTFLIEVFPEDLVTEKTQKKKENDNTNNKDNMEMETNINFEKLIDIVFDEIVSNDRRKYIDYDDFNTVMWTTEIDKSCIIDFANQ